MRAGRRPDKQSYGSYRPWDRQLTRTLLTRYREDGDEDARDELVAMYLSLVRYLATRFANRGEPLDDLIQVGTIGLLKAIDRFDMMRQVQFTTYATPTIIGEIKRYFRDKGWAVRVPRRLQELSLKINDAVDVMTQEYQRSPTITEIATYLGVTSELVLEAMEISEAYNFVPLDVDRVVDEAEDLDILDQAEEDDSIVRIIEDRDVLSVAFRKLSPLERKVVFFRFFKGMTQGEIASHLGTSQIRVSKTLRHALEVIRDNTVGEV